MSIIFFSDDTRIRISEGHNYKRTVYLLDHNVTAAVTSGIYQYYLFRCNYYYYYYCCILFMRNIDVLYHAACKVEFQPFNRSYSQLTFTQFLYKMYTTRSRFF